jgi:crotonobetainyl-CoA:carnitine CoA-transferase CaiB-like acyl-CoA transferase
MRCAVSVRLFQEVLSMAEDRPISSTSEPLAGISVVECGQGVAAAFAAKMLADLGAEVVKVEPPEGDLTRRRGPFPGGVQDPEHSGLFQYLNTNKRSVVLDLHTAPGRDRLNWLLGRSDILIHNVPPAGQGACGLVAGELTATHPALTVVEISMLGNGGPRSHYRGYELQAFHAGGIASLTPRGESSAVRPPLKLYGHQAEFQAAAHGAFLALAAYWGRMSTGQGQAIDISVQECLTAFFELSFIGYTYSGKRDTRDTAKPVSPWNIMRTGDGGHIFFCCGEQDQWLRLVELMGNPDWAREERFKDSPSRGQNSKALRALMEQWARDWTLKDLCRECDKRRVPAAPLNRMADLYADEGLAERDFFVELPGRDGGQRPIRVPGAPFKSTADGWSLRSPAPLLGEHQEEVFHGFAPPPASSGRAARAAKPGELPLHGVRVLDFSWIWAGPYATLQLAHLGAEVIRVESVKRPCLNRRVPPFLDGVPGLERSGSFCQWNQGKRSLALDLSNPQAIEIARRLVPHCDIVVENFAPGVAERMGLGYRQLRELRDGLIMLSISGYGQTGPRRSSLSYGALTGAAAGLNSVLGYAPGEAEEIGITWADPVAGLFGAHALIAALIHRKQTGQGQYIDLSMLEMLETMMPEALLECEIGGREPQPIGNHDQWMAPHNCYKASGDAECWVTIAAGSDEEWRALCHAIGQPALADDPRFLTASMRKRHEDELDAIITAWTSQHDRWQATELLQNAGVAAFPTMNNQDLGDDPHLKARGFYVELEHPVVGRQRHAGIPWHMSPSDCRVHKPAPLLGADTEDILASLLGYSPDEIARMREERVLY